MNEEFSVGFHNYYDSNVYAYETYVVNQGWASWPRPWSITS